MRAGRNLSPGEVLLKGNDRAGLPSLATRLVALKDLLAAAIRFLLLVWFLVQRNFRLVILRIYPIQVFQSVFLLLG